MAASGLGTTTLGAAAQAKQLLRISKTGALATLGVETGAPLTTQVGCASDVDGSPLFLLSTLAQHTRNLAADPRASLLLASSANRGDPLNCPRVSLGGLILPDPAPGARRRYLQRNPKAELYARFQDFAIFRMRIDSVHYNGGFGRADALTPADLLTPDGAAAALIEAEDGLLAWINGAEGALAGRLAAGSGPRRHAWRAVGLDPEGLDLAAGRLAVRVDFAAPAFDPLSWRSRLEDTLIALGARRAGPVPHQP